MRTHTHTHTRARARARVEFETYCTVTPLLTYALRSQPGVAFRQVSETF